MLKYTRSKDGKPRATVRIKYRTDRDEIVAIVAYLLSSSVEEFSRITKKLIEEKLRLYLHADGKSFYENLQEIGINECMEEAEEIIDRLYPELKRTEERS